MRRQNEYFNNVINHQQIFCVINYVSLEFNVEAPHPLFFNAQRFIPVDFIHSKKALLPTHPLALNQQMKF